MVICYSVFNSLQLTEGNFEFEHSKSVHIHRYPDQTTSGKFVHINLSRPRAGFEPPFTDDQYYYRTL